MVRIATLSLAAALACATGNAGAQTYPEPGRAIRVVVPFAAGGGTDAVTRIVAEHVARKWSASFVIENKAGGGTMIATQSVGAAPADGYTVLAISNSFLVSPLLAERPPYDPLRDFVTVAPMASSPHVLVVHPSVPATTVAEFAAWAKANPARATFASFGRGASNHFGFEVLKRRLGIEIVHAPYGGSAPALKDLIGGHVPVMLGDLQNVREQIGGNLRALAVANETRLAALPGVPTMAEAGVPGFTSKSWFGLVLKAGTDPAIVEKWNAAVREALRDPSVRARLEPHGVTIPDMPVAAFAAFLVSENEAAHRIAREAGLR